MGGSSSQYSQLQTPPEEPQPSPEQSQPLSEAEPRRNPVRNHRPPSYGTDSDRHIH
ncbi:hypothetical protein PVK06_016275 [Gossypium arboreum]|uniref:Uncharacterized protein n=1 Tax=Gossypium arboreum TaxID=29729 RepID=A0ABR0Q0E4_GOSAR|nr:hypothetical protein PVK06_016275 [Gossypium arboreum]